MSRADENAIDPPEYENIGYVKTIVDGYVTDVGYCTNCGSVDIKTSKRGNLYCGKICRKEEESLPTNSTNNDTDTENRYG